MIRYLAAACLALALAAGVQSWRLERVKTELHDANQLVVTYRRAYRKAKGDAQTVADQCAARVEEARASAQRIETIIQREVPRDPQGCPLRVMLPAGELRDTLQPDAGAAEP